MGGVSPKALEFAILCASRSNEVRGAKWDEFDIKSKIWTVPRGRMKEGQEHQVPLSARAIELLTAIKCLSPDSYVFPGMRQGRPLSDMALSAVLRRLGCSYTTHGFRATFRMWCGDTNAEAREIAEMCLSHKVGTRVELAYARTTMLDRRRAVLEAWAKYCGTLPITSEE